MTTDAPTINRTALAREIAENIRQSLRDHHIRELTSEEQTDLIGKALATLSEDRRAELLQTLFRGFDTIAHLGNGKQMALYADSSPLSFTWGGNGWLGGLIFHGSHDGGGDGGAPSFSVCLTPTDGWSIHT